MGTTSACAENTIGERLRPPAQRNYLRVRGEYFFRTRRSPKFKELPPRARRIPTTSKGVGQIRGTTSACAENTAHPLDAARLIGNYLRVRGEYGRRMLVPIQSLELPPRARRIRELLKRHQRGVGTTSACAENTRYRPRHHEDQWNYLRVRGEYAARRLKQRLPRELPPRARRILFGPLHPRFHGGTTSACAENTLLDALNSVCPGNYLRVRGEYHSHRCGF